MKILHVIPSLGSGGAERFVVDLCNELSIMGHDVYLCCLYRFNLDESLFFYKNELRPEVHLFSANKSLGLSINAVLNLRNQINAIRPDIINSHLRAITYLLPIMYLKKNIKFFHTVHNDAAKEAGGRLSTFLRKLAFKGGICYPITISEDSDKSFLSFYGRNTNHKLICNGAKYIVPNTSDAKEVNQFRKEGKRVLVNIARITPQKNQLTLINAVADFNDIELLLIGNCDSEYAFEIKEQLPTNCHILGPRKNPRDYMAAADAFILPSIYEGMPISLIEAFSVGCLPIVSKVGGVVNMVKDGKNGLVIGDTSVESIQQCLRRYMTLSDIEIDSLKSNAKKSFGRYDIRQCALNYSNFYKQISAL